MPQVEAAVTKRLGRPPLTEGARPRKRMVLLPPELDAAAERAKGGAKWATWLRALVEQAVRRDEK